MKSILDPSFRYTASFNTDIRKTFARVRRERIKLAAQAKAGAPVELRSIVVKVAAGR